MRLLATFILFIQSISFTLAQDTVSASRDDLTLIKDFVNDLANEEIKTDVILSQYVLVQHPNDELYDYLEVSLEEIRINLLSKKLEDIVYTPYKKMPRKEVWDIDLEYLDSERIYFLHYKNRHLLALYLDQDKIASFTLVSKGRNKAHFVLY